MPRSDLAILNTRPASSARPLSAKLKAAGYRCFELPTLEIVPCDPSVSFSDAFDLVLFISGNAVTHGMSLLDTCCPSWRQWPVLAVGEATAAILAEAGIKAQTPETGEDSDALLALAPLSHVGGRRVLIVKGEGGRKQLEETLRARGAQVETMSVYRRVAPATPEFGVLDDWANCPYKLVLIYSGESLTNYARWVSVKYGDKALAWPMVTIHPRIAKAAKAMGYQRVHSVDTSLATWTDQLDVFAASNVTELR